MNTQSPSGIKRPFHRSRAVDALAPTNWKRVLCSAVGKGGFWLKALCIPALVLLTLGAAIGAPVDVKQAEAAVRGWLRTDASPLKTAMGQQIKQVEEFDDAQGAPLYYVVYLDPEGFVIVPADDRIEPIMGFAATGQFDPSPNNPLGALINRDMAGRLASLKNVVAASALKASSTSLSAKS